MSLKFVEQQESSPLEFNLTFNGSLGGIQGCKVLTNTLSEPLRNFEKKWQIDIPLSICDLIIQWLLTYLEFDKCTNGLKPNDIISLSDKCVKFTFCVSKNVFSLHKNVLQFPVSILDGKNVILYDHKDVT